MSKIAQLNITKRGIALRVICFAAAIGLIVLCVPTHGGRFRYEYQKGRQWAYDDLVAQFDFPLYKTDLELLNERNQILATYSAVFRLDPMPARDAELNFRLDFDRLWNAHLQRAELSRTAQQHLAVIREGYIGVGLRALAHIYRSGIIDKTTDIDLSGRSTITVIHDDVAYDYDFSNVLTRRNAAKYLGDVIRQEASAISAELMPVWNAMDVNRYVAVNLLYDGYLTQRYKSELLANVSQTRGMVRTGEHIISQGEVVSSETYQIIESMRREYEKQRIGERNPWLLLFGNAMVVAALFLALFLFLTSDMPQIVESRRKLLFVLLLITIFSMLGILLPRFSHVSLYILPLVIVPIIINTFFEVRLALFVHIITVLMVGFFAPNSLEFIVLNFVAGVVALSTLANYYHRGRLFVTISTVYLAMVAVYLGFVIVQEGTPLAANPYMFLWFLANALLLLLSYQLVYAFEKIFGFLSDATLAEISDTNMELLRQLAENAPGTFQHSLQVANLAQSAAYKINANPLLVRAGALYHDIGKLSMPMFYTENQHGGANPHDGLPPEESARVIVGHVVEGVGIAHRAGLPDAIVQFIRSHHGTLHARYFWHAYQQLHPEATEADMQAFTYPGPTPTTKEQALVMMADTVEAASRSLKNIDQNSINNLVDSLIDQQLQAGQFLNADLTFSELASIKADFKQKLSNIYHVRIAYPKTAK